MFYIFNNSQDFISEAIMKKTISILFILLIIIFFAPQYTIVDTVARENGTLYIYTYEYAKIKNTNTIKNGNSYIITCDIKSGKKALKSLNKSQIRGFSAVFEGTMQSIMQLKDVLKLNVIYQEHLEKIEFLYGYSPAFENYTTYNNSKINVQIAKQNDQIHIGVPLILGSI